MTPLLYQLSYSATGVPARRAERYMARPPRLSSKARRPLAAALGRGGGR